MLLISQLKQLVQTEPYSLHRLNVHSDPLSNRYSDSRITTIFFNNNQTNIIESNPDMTTQKYKETSSQKNNDNLFCILYSSIFHLVAAFLFTIFIFLHYE